MSPRSTVVILCATASAMASPAADAAERTYTLRAGPYRLANFETVLPRESVRTPRVNGWVTRMHAQLVDRRGRRLTLREVMLHHVVFTNKSVRRPPGYCSPAGREAFYGTGEENQALELPAGYGYSLRQNDRWRMGAMLMSHSLPAHNAYVEYRVTVESRALRAVHPYWVRASGCAPNTAYSIRGGGAPGSVSDRVERWPIPFDARIVAAGGHLHGGAVDLRMTQPACEGRLLFHNRPAYAPPDHLVYRARPVMHEVGPLATSWFSSRTGIPVRRGEMLELHGLYDAEHPHPGVMAITHVYLARSSAPKAPCGPLPAHRRQARAPAGSRLQPPWSLVPLTTLNARGRPVELDEPPGPTVALRSGATIAVRDHRFVPAKVTVSAGSRIRWRWEGRAAHNIKFANGPHPVGSRARPRGTVIARDFAAPGRFQMFCSRHPLRMHAQVTVRG